MQELAAGLSTTGVPGSKFTPGWRTGGLGRGSVGVPEEAFIILPGDARSTQDEALIVTQYLKKQQLDVDTVLLVSLLLNPVLSKIYIEESEEYAGFMQDLIPYWKSLQSGF